MDKKIELTMSKIKNSRAMSFAVVTLVYVLAGVVGVLVYRACRLEWWLSLLVADVTATVFTFIFSLIFKNASVYDPYWSVQPPVIVIAFAIGREITALGVLIIIAIFVWAIRLTANWAYTFYGLDHQDWRYTMLAEKTGKFYPIINFVGIHMVPTLVVYFCTLPAVYVIVAGVELAPLSVVFICLSLFAATIQGIADVEMHKYQKDRHSTFIRDGLWKYSRHPNYLGEILMWWGIGLAAVTSAPDATYLLVGAIANTALFFFVSIPMADGKQSHKEGFAQYRAETRALLPIKK